MRDLVDLADIPPFDVFAPTRSDWAFPFLDPRPGRWPRKA